MRKFFLWASIGMIVLALAVIGGHYIWFNQPVDKPVLQADSSQDQQGQQEDAGDWQEEFGDLQGALEKQPETPQAGTELPQERTNPPQGSNSPRERTDAPQATQEIQEVVKVTIPEGFTFYQVARRLEANEICTAQAFYDAAQSYQVQSFAVPYSKESCYYLEGFLFPDTYEFYKGEAPENVLRKILNNYKAKSGLPDYNTLILASIIERETRSSAHMAMVSSIFYNRLDINMRLQADATRAYVEQHIKPSWVNNPEQYAARYNTYVCSGLPVGPICSPGIRAIEAAKNPSRSDYLYYFFGNDNTNHYTKTHDEHKAAMAQFGVNYG